MGGLSTPVSPYLSQSVRGTLLTHLSVGHVHDGGTGVSLTINGEKICTSEAKYGGPGHTTTGPDGKTWETMSSMTPCKELIPLKKGDKIILEADFDTEKHPA